MRKLANTIAGLICILSVTSGCGYESFPLNPAKQIGKKTVVSEHSAWNSTYWSHQNPNYLEPQLLSANKNYLTVKVMSAEIPSGSTIERIIMNPQTTIRDNGKVMKYSVASGQIKPGDTFTVIAKKQGSQLVAKQIYGPDSQIYGIIQSATGSFVIVRELKQTMDTNNLKEYSGRVIKLEFDSRTNFEGSSPLDLKAGYMLQAQVGGNYPDCMLMYSGIISIGRKLPNGVTQWADIMDSD